MICPIDSTGCGVDPGDDVLPCALARNPPYSSFVPVDGLRVTATPVPDRSPLLPKTICTTLTAVLCRRDVVRPPVHPGAACPTSEEARTARISCTVASVGKSLTSLEPVDGAVRVDEHLDVLGRQVGVVVDAAVALQRGERVPNCGCHAVDHLAEHLISRRYES
jgi:hypothetical protein